MNYLKKWSCWVEKEWVPEIEVDAPLHFITVPCLRIQTAELKKEETFLAKLYVLFSGARPTCANC